MPGVFKLHYLIILVMTHALVSARSFSVSNAACDSMTPEHGSNQPQTTIARFQIIPHQIKLNRGQEMKVTLQRTSNNFTFRGFMLQSRDINTNRVVGYFILKNYNVISCGESSNTATHRDPSQKISETLIWRAPKQYSGFVKF